MREKQTKELLDKSEVFKLAGAALILQYWRTGFGNLRTVNGISEFMGGLGW